ncbi:MAG TPA: BON domain-containing protein [Gaiellaceae bacterium]|nr:BON domain-containing protein [Gaiellaceae bacterium]
MGKISTLGIGAMLGGAGAYVVLRSEAAGRALGGRMYGMVPRPRGVMDDVTLSHQVESELFRSHHDVKGRVSVNAADGVVQLRGEVDSPELIDDLVARARTVRGVADVENLLHTPGTSAPMHQ